MENLGQILLQTFVAFFSILVLARILGKQQISQITFYEYITGITFGSIAANMVTEIEQSMAHHLLGLVFFGLLTWIMSYISIKNRPLRKLIGGDPVIVIQNGKIFENNLKKMFFNLDELTSELRSKNIFNISDVELAIIEPSGKLSVLKYPELEYPTRQDLGIAAFSKGIDVEVIVDGQLIYTNLKNMGLNAKWLMKQLKLKGIRSLKEVAYASINASHELYVDTYEDQVEGMMDISDDFQLPFTMDTIKYGEQDEKS